MEPFSKSLARRTIKGHSRATSVSTDFEEVKLLKEYVEEKREWLGRHL